MAEFLIKAADERGHLLQQVENGYSEAEVRDRLVQQGLLVYWVKPRTLLSGDLTVRRRGKVKQSQFVIFNAAVPDADQSRLAHPQFARPADQAAAEQVFSKSACRTCATGSREASCCRTRSPHKVRFPASTPPLCWPGKKAATWKKFLTRYIAFQRLALTFKKKLAVSLVYPTLLVTVVFGMMIFLVTYVVPQFAKLYEDMHAQLPAITLVMLNIGTHAQAYAPFVIVAVVAASVGFLVLAKNRQWCGRDRWRHFEASPAGRNLAKVSADKLCIKVGVG